MRANKHYRKTWLMIVLIIAFSLSWTAQIKAEVGKSPDITSGGTSDYIIGPHNLLHIKILSESGIQETFRVDQQGFITHPLAGRIMLGGHTAAQAEQILTSALKGDYIIDPHITVFVLEHSRFSILGEVRKAGTYEITGKVSIVEAISMAGGFSPIANESKVKILRQTAAGEEAIIVNVKKIIQDTGNTEVPNIVAGDVIIVPKSFF